MSTKIRWGLLAAGNIAHAFAAGVQHCELGVLHAVGSRDLDRSNAFADEFDIPQRYGSYDELLADPDVDAVYISTRHPQHAEWAIKTAEAGKHILCEKPLAMNAADAAAIIDAAQRHDVFLMEAFMYRCNPQTARLVELLREKPIGEVRMIRASFGFSVGDNYDSRAVAYEHGGGAILDVGCYTVSMSRLIAGTVSGLDFLDPIDVQGIGHLGPAATDEWAAAVLEFPNGIVAEVSTGVRLTLDNVLTIFGSDGMIHLPSPWFCSGREGGSSTIEINLTGEEPRIEELSCDGWLYGLEADVVARNIENRQSPSPAMSWADTMGNMRTLDAWRRCVGLTYNDDLPAGRPRTVSGRSLQKAPDAPMQYGTIAGLDKPVSRLVIGCDTQNNYPHLEVIFDAYFEAGGTTIDTSFHYGALRGELLGQWMKMRGVRDDLVIIAKGAHSPNCFPDTVTEQLAQSLEHMQIDYADIYILHRDNPDVPIGEFVDLLNEHADAGRIGIFGGSNWTIDRLRAANEYAAANGKRGFSVVSNQLSLAVMNGPVWEGCISARGEAWSAFLQESQMSLLPWSSQARGFFVPDRAAPDKRDDVEMVRCWYSDDNFERQRRAIELAEKKGVLPINIAGAWVLQQPFPTFALFGPRQLSELRSSLGSLAVELTAEEMAWLDLAE